VDDADRNGVAAVTRARAASLAIAALAAVLAITGCGGLQGFGGPTPPLVSFQVLVTGDLGPVRPPGITSEQSLQVAIVWGDQWQTEPFCILPAESPDAAAVIAAGCRDPFGFVPLLVGATVPVTVGVPATLSLYDLPSADVMVGDITSRVAYASLVVYDDRNGTGTLDLAAPHRTPMGGRRADEQVDTPDSPDIVYGASFVTMTAPDQRVAFREGTFTPSAFYPRAGCGDPLVAPGQSSGFSVLAAGGFSAAAGISSSLVGQLPPEDPASCSELPPDDPGAVITFGVQTPASVQEVGCMERTTDSSVRYREPPTNMPDFSGRLTACAHLPAFDAGDQSDLVQLVVSGRPQDRCVGLTHYTLRGCRENVACPVPDWDFTANPPAWWPCPMTLP
jgi:hypothetical protein